MRNWHKRGDARIAQVAARETQTKGTKGRFRLNTGQTKAARLPQRTSKHLPGRIEVPVGPRVSLDHSTMSHLAVADIDPFKSLPISIETSSAEALLQMCEQSPSLQRSSEGS